MKIPHRFLKGLFPHRIGHQIFFILVFLVVIPLVILGLSLIETSKKAVKTTVLRDHKELAIHATGELREYIKGPIQALHITASILGTLHAEPWRQETSIVELALRYPIFQRISSLNVEGQEIVTSELGTLLLDQSDQIGFQKIKEGESFYISEIKISENHMPMLKLATPIKQLGKITGVLVADVNLRGVWDIVDGIHVGETGRAHLINHEGRLLSHPDKKAVLQNQNPLSLKVNGSVLPGQARSSEEVDVQGQRWLVSYAPIDNLNWGLVIMQSTKEAFAFSKVMRRNSWLLIIVSVLAALMVSFVLSKIMSRPINTLIKATQNVANQDFDHRLRISRRDEIGRLFRSFNRMVMKLGNVQREERLSTIGKAATAIAHELKNSLVSVNTYIRLLPERHKDEDFVKDFSRTVPQELNAWKKMLQNMGDYSRFQKFDMEDVYINEILEDVTILARQRAAQKNVELIVETKNILPSITGNADKLRQVFLNLISNALEATPEGGTITLSIDLVSNTNNHSGSCIEIRVDNQGKGIAQEDLTKIFEPFYTTKRDGLGLGLSISREIVELHGGWIDAINQESGGTSFIVMLPLIVKVEKSQIQA